MQLPEPGYRQDEHGDICRKLGPRDSIRECILINTLPVDSSIPECLNWNAGEDDGKYEADPPSNAKTTSYNGNIFEILARKYAVVEEQKRQSCCRYREGEDNLGYPVILYRLVMPLNT